MPILPFLTDSIAHLERAFAAIRDAGADSVAYSALHLRPGAREWYLAWLEREHPDLVPRYREMYGTGSYADKRLPRLARGAGGPLLRKYGLERPPRLDPATGVPRAGAIRDATLDAATRAGAAVRDARCRRRRESDRRRASRPRRRRHPADALLSTLALAALPNRRRFIRLGA